jgi:hypothetical protein
VFGLFQQRKPRPLPADAGATRRRGAGRPTRTEAAERRRQAIADQKAELDLALGRARVEKELRKLQGADEQPITLADVGRIARQLDVLGLEIRPKGGGPALTNDDGLRGFLKGFLNEDGGKIAARFVPVLQGLTGDGHPAHGQRVDVWRPGEAPPPAQETPALGPAGLVLPTPDDLGQMHPDSQAFLRGVCGQTPADGVAWLLTQREAAPLIERIRSTPDDELGGVLELVRRLAPTMGHAAGWLAQHPDWFVQAARVIRGDGGQPAAPDAPPPPGSPPRLVHERKDSAF